LWFSGLLLRLMWWLDINVSQGYSASIFRVDIQLPHYTA